MIQGGRIFTCMERIAAIVKISSEHPSSFEAKIIFAIIGSYIKLEFWLLIGILFVSINIKIDSADIHTK